MNRCEIRTRSRAPERVAAALTPDNTAELSTRVEEGTVVTTLERDTTGGLRATLDDYLVNLSVAERVVRTTEQHSTDDQPDDIQS